MIRKLNIALAISALALSLYVVIVPVSPTAAVGHFATDHYSHYNSSIMFWHRGLAIYSTPIRILCAPTTDPSKTFAKEHGLDPIDLCDLPERAGDRPLVINWSQFPRPYPPGAILYAAPEAVLYADTGLSVRTVNRISIIKHILAGHLLVAMLFGYLFGGPDTEERRWWRTAGFFLGPVVYFIVVPYAMAGFYDPVAILCICWAITRLDRDRPLEALAFLSLAGFLHFRALWFAPLGLVTLARLRGHRDQLRTRRGIALVAVSCLLSAAAGLSFVLVFPYLTMFPHSNPMQFSALGVLAPAQVDYLALIAVVVGYLVWQREWLLVGLAIWIVLVIGLTAQAQQWHPMFLLPMLVVARSRRARPPTIIAIVLFIFGIARLVYGLTPTPGPFLGAIFRLNI